MPCSAMTDRMITPGPSRGGRARVVMGDFKVLARGFDVIAGWLVEDEASVDDWPAMPVRRGVDTAAPNVPSRARACTCIVHLTSSIGVLQKRGSST